MSELAVICPSKGRAGRVKTLSWLPGLVLFVHESEAEAYRRAHRGVEVVTHDNTGTPGTMETHHRIRNDIIERWPDGSFTVDDDLPEMRSVFTAPGEKPIRPKGDLAHAILQRLYDEAVDLGVHLFGFAPTAHPLHYDPLKPYTLKGAVTDHAMGVRDTPHLRFPVGHMMGEHWMALLNAYHYRTVLVDNRWCIVNKGHPENSQRPEEGGLAGVDRGHLARARELVHLHNAFGEVLEIQTVAERGGNHDRARIRIPY